MKTTYTQEKKNNREAELKKYLQDHDLMPDEEDLLTDWVHSGHSIYSNPDQQFDDYGSEVPYMKWYWMKQDPLHPGNRKRPLIKAMTLNYETGDLEEDFTFLENAQRIMRDEIIMYRRFLAQYPGAVGEFENYRRGCMCRKQNE